MREKTAISEILFILSLFSFIFCIISIRAGLNNVEKVYQVLLKRSEYVEKNHNPRLAHLPAINGERYKRIFSITDGVKYSNSNRKAFALLRSVLCRTRVKESIALMSIYEGSVYTRAWCVVFLYPFKKNFQLHARKTLSHLATNFF